MTVWLIIKLLHVFAGVFWFGAAAILVFFIMPTAGAVGPGAAPFITHLNTKLQLPRVVLWAASINLVMGLGLMWRVSAGFNADYFKSPGSHAVTMGAAFGIIAFLIAMMVQIPRAKHIAQLTTQAAEKPSDALTATLATERKKFALGGKFLLVALTISLIGMLLAHPM